LATFYEIRWKIHLRQKKYAAALAELNNYFNVYAGRIVMFWRCYSYRALTHFHLGHYGQALADVAHSIEIRPDDFDNVTWISPDLVASCPDEKFRAGMLALAGKVIERTGGKAGGYVARGHLYKALKQYDQARADFEKVVELGKAVELGASDARTLNSLAWFLATSSEVEFRDPKRAVALARKAVELTPMHGNHWNTLGVAHYRAGDWKAAVTALEKSSELAGGTSFNSSASSSDFFLAMAHWQLGDRQQARTWYDKAVAGMKRNDAPAHEEELKRFRAEAAELLGVKDPPSRKETAPVKP
jgi:tetratricopeptide (TPR) repeat protein